MKRNQRRIAVVMFLVLVVPSLSLYFLSHSDEDVTLFNITRNLDDDLLNYDLNLDKEGKLDFSDPIHPYWIRNSKGGIAKELNGIQRKFAYGLKYIKKEKGTYMFQFVSYNKRNFYLKKDKAGNYRVYTKIGDDYVIVRNIHLNVTKNGDSLLDMPKVSHIDIKYLSDSNGKESSKRIYI